MQFLFIFLTTLLVRNQADVASLQTRIEAVPETEEQLEIRFAPGVYYYPEDFLRIEAWNRPGMSLSIVGEDAVLIGSDAYDGIPDIGAACIDTVALRHIDSFTEMRQASCWPLRIPFRKNLYSLRCRGENAEDYPPGTELMMTQWYIGAVYPIERIGRRRILFRREKHYTGIWAELRYGRCLPRYLFRIIPQDPMLYRSRAVRFLRVEGATLSSLSIRGFRFLGNGEGEWLMELSGLLAGDVSITDCRFEGIRSGGINVIDTDNFRMEENRAERCYHSMVYINAKSKKSVIRDNVFINCGYAVSNDPIVNCKGEDFLVSGNYFEDFSYSAIGVGQHFFSKETAGNSGVVEKNEICMSEAFRRGVYRELIDSGAIYVWTFTNGIIIRDNYIHDLAGPHGNRGILCDDGTINVTICGNRIVRVRSSYCIDLRRHRRVERDPRSGVRRANVGNVMYGNIVDGECRFQIRKNDPSSMKGENIVL